MFSNISVFDVIRFIIHYGGHFLAPALIAFIFYRKKWQKSYYILIATMLVDLDHLLADPIFDPTRMSVGFHLLHSYPAIAVYFIMLFHQRTRLVGIGLLFHMVTDFIDYSLLQFQ